MRIKFLLSLAAIAPAVMMAETLSPQDALQRALGDSQVRKAVSSSTSAPRLLYTEMDAYGADPAAYVFSRGNDGFMVLAADDIAAPVLGYSDQSGFDPGNMPANLRAWLAFYADEIAWARRNGVATYSAPARSARVDRPAIAPLVKTAWDQGAPYNSLLPKVGSNNVVTGCVATAMAQIMKYHQWPQGPGSGSASVSVTNSGTYSMDFSQTTFDWANMLDRYTSSATQVQKDAVGLLMKACGFSVDMTYRTTESGAVQSLVGSALINNFGYDKGVIDVKRELYTGTQWNDLIYDQISKKQPVQYGGQSSQGGHSFVCDGYSENNYFHINWGWGGISDGYFLLSALDPTSQGTGGSGDGSGFNADQDAVINIRKPSGTQDIVAHLYAESLTVKSGAASFNSTFSASLAGLGNNSYISPLEGMLGVALVNKSTGARIICVSTGTTFSLPTGNYYTSAIGLNCRTHAAGDMPAGEYDVVPVFSVGTGSDATYDWKEIPTFAGSDKITATVTSSGITFTTLTSDIATTDITIGGEGVLYRGYPSTILVTVKNSGNNVFIGSVKARLRRATTTTVVATGSAMEIELGAGETKAFEYPMTVPTSVSAGTYNIVFIDGTNKVITARAKTGIEVANAPALELSFGSLKIVGDINNVDPKNFKATTALTCSSFKFNGTFNLYFFNMSGGTNIDYLASDPVSISAGETKDVVFSGTVNALEPGTRYFCSVNYDGKLVTDNLVFTTKADAGINDIEADADVIAEHYYNLQGIRVSGTPSVGHYIKVAIHADGSRTTEHVVIK